MLPKRCNVAQNQTTSQPLLLTWPSLVKVIGLSGVQAESNWASDFKSAEGVARSYFQITSAITPELFDTKSCYQLIMSVTKCQKPGSKDLI